MKKKIVLDGKVLTKKDIANIKKHPKTIAFLNRNKNALNGVDLSILKPTAK